MTSWQVEVITSPGQDLNDDQLGRLTETLPAAAFTYNKETHSVGIRFPVDARTQAEAVRIASKRITEAARQVFDDVIPFLGIRIARGDKDLVPAFPEIVGYIEIAAIIGAVKGKTMHRQRARELAEKHPDFPAPVARLGMGPVFALEEVLEFARTWEAKAGRPRTNR